LCPRPRRRSLAEACFSRSPCRFRPRDDRRSAWRSRRDPRPDFRPDCLADFDRFAAALVFFDLAERFAQAQPFKLREVTP